MTMNEKMNDSTMGANAVDAQRSLDIISRMIADTSAHIDSNAGRYCLAWGYTTVLVSIFEYVAQISGWNMHLCLWVWFLIPIVGGFFTRRFARSDMRRVGARPKSYLDRCVSIVWTVFGMSSLLAYAAALAYNVSLLFLIVMLMGMGTVITGAICRHRFLAGCGIASMFLSLIFPIMHIVLQRMKEDALQELDVATIYSDIIIFAVIFLVMMVIPGHILVNRAKKLDNV